MFRCTIHLRLTPLPTLTALRRQNESVHANRCFKDTMLVVMERPASAAAARQTSTSNNNSSVPLTSSELQKQQENHLLDLLPTSATDTVLCVFPPFSERWDSNRADPLELFLHSPESVAAASMMSRAAPSLPGASSAAGKAKTLRLPLCLALNFPLSGATAQERERFLAVCEPLLNISNYNKNNNNNNRSNADQKQQQQQQQLGLSSKDELSNAMKIIGRLPSRRVLLFADAQVQLPTAWSIRCVNKALRGGGDCSELVSGGDAKDGSAAVAVPTLFPVGASSVWCATFAQWYVDRRSGGTGGGAFDPARFALTPASEADTMSQFRKQQQQLAIANSRSTIAQQRQPHVQPLQITASDAILPPVVNAYIHQVAEAKSKCCLATALVKLDALTCTSQMSFVGLHVQDDEYFARQKDELLQRCSQVVREMKSELRRFMPNSFEENNNNSNNIISNSSSHAKERFTGHNLKDIVLGPSRDDAIMVRPLCLAYGWIAVSLYLYHTFRSTPTSAASSTDKQQQQQQQHILSLRGTSPHCLQYAASYFSDVGLPRVDDDPEDSAPAATKKKEKKSATTDEQQRQQPAAIKPFSAFASGTDNDITASPAALQKADGANKQQQNSSSNSGSASLWSFDSQFTAGPRSSASSSSLTPLPFHFGALMPQGQLSHGFALAKKKATVAEHLPPWLLRSADVIHDVRRQFDAEKKLQEQQLQQRGGKHVDDDEIEEDSDGAVDQGSSATAKIDYSSVASNVENATTAIKRSGGGGAAAAALASPRWIAAQIFDCLLTMRLITPRKYGEDLQVEVTFAPAVLSTTAGATTTTFQLHDVVEFRSFVAEKCHNSSSSSEQGINSSTNTTTTDKPLSSVDAPADAVDAPFYRGKVRALVMLLDGATCQDILLLSLLRRMSDDEMQAAEVSVSFCAMDFAAVEQNLNRTFAASSSLLRGNDVAHLIESAAESAVAAATEQLQQQHQHNPSLHAILASADDEDSFAHDPSSPNRTSTSEMMSRVLLFGSTSAAATTIATASTKFIHTHDVIYNILVAAGSALTSAPGLDPFLSSFSSSDVNNQDNNNVARIQAGTVRDGVLLDHLPDSPFRSRLLTAHHSGQFALVETLARFNSPLARGTSELEEIDQVLTDLATLRKSAHQQQQNKKQPAGSSSSSSGGRFLHAKIRSTSVVSGRLSASNPNIFAISKSPNIRGAFNSRFGPRGVMLEADYSQMEVIVLCALTGDTAMHDDLVNNINFHNKRVTFLKPELSYDEVCVRLKRGDAEIAALRKIAKTFTFQRQYGAGARAISDATGLELSTVQQLMVEESKAYPEVERYFSALAREMLRRKEFSAHVPSSSPAARFVASSARLEMQLPSGSIIPFDSSEIAAFATPKLRNYPVQGLAADLMQLALAELWRRLRSRADTDCVIVNVVHDSVWLDVAEHAVKDVREIVRSVLEGVTVHAMRHIGLDLMASKFKVDICVGPNLAQMK